MRENMPFVLPALGSLVIGFVIMFVLEWMKPALVTLNAATPLLFTLADQTAGADSGSIAWNLIYSFSDFTMGPFLSDPVASLFMFIGALANLYLTRMGSAHRGYWGLGNLWVWLVCAQAAAMVLANLFWRFVVGWEGWFPSFVPLVSVTPMAIVSFGHPDWRKALTGIGVGALLPVYVARCCWCTCSSPSGFPRSSRSDWAWPAPAWSPWSCSGSCRG